MFMNVKIVESSYQKVQTGQISLPNRLYVSETIFLTTQVPPPPQPVFANHYFSTSDQAFVEACSRPLPPLGRRHTAPHRPISLLHKPGPNSCPGAHTKKM